MPFDVDALFCVLSLLNKKHSFEVLDILEAIKENKESLNQLPQEQKVRLASEIATKCPDARLQSFVDVLEKVPQVPREEGDFSELLTNTLKERIHQLPRLRSAEDYDPSFFLSYSNDDDEDAPNTDYCCRIM